MTNIAYTDLEMRYRRIAILTETASILHWDSATIMPKGSASARAEQIAELKAITHALKSSPEVGELIVKAKASAFNLNTWQQANLNEMARQWTKANAVPEELVVALSKACSACEIAWRNARPEADYAAVKPLLQNVLDLTRDAAQVKGEALDLSLYDALLDDYEPGCRNADLEKIFQEINSFLPSFIDDALVAQSTRPAPLMPEGPFPILLQENLGKYFMKALGFDFNHGRLDVSLHPFCGGTPDDVRITTRYDEASFTSSLMGIFHETGHAMYERGLPTRWRYQPVGDTLGMGMHESQSLLIEMQVCRSRSFFHWAAPILRETFKGQGPNWDPENLYRLHTRVKPDFIRVDADELTYPAHVILRYRLERALLSKDLTLRDLPAAWNDLMKELLGIVPPSDREGCLQDLHWYDGAWGYFPTYTLGAITAAQLYTTACKTDPNIEVGIRKGNFVPLMSWLRTHVHNSARLMCNASELLTNITGEPLNSEFFKDHLHERYLS